MSTKEKERKQPSRAHSGKSAAPRKRPAATAKKESSATPARRKPVWRTVEPVKTAPVRRRTEEKPAEQPKTAVDVVYLPPKPFNRKRFLLHLATVAAVVIALLLGLSVFFKVDESKILVSGNNKYTAWDISQASQIKTGDNLLTFSRARAVAKIRKALPYVEDIRIGIKLPDTVMIYVTEVEVPYAVKAQDDSWWLISSSGTVIEKAEDGAQSGYTKILGIQISEPQSGQLAAALENANIQTDPDGNTIPVTVKQSQRLKTALNIADYLELNGIIGQATSIDVNDLADIQVMYGQQYQVKLGNETQLSYKISCMKYAIDKLDVYQSGVLDISFTTWQDKVGFTPFDDDRVSILQIT